jgi:hypothetical protein
MNAAPTTGPRGQARPRLAVALLLGIFAVFFAPVLFGGEVLYPNDNAAQVGLAGAASATRSTERFGDMSAEYLPELQQHLASGHASWLATWNPHNAFGLPLMQYYGLGRAFLLGHALAALTQDPFTTWTLLCLLALLAAAGFAFLFLRGLKLHPLACLAGALAISLCPLHAGWETFPQLDWDFAWTFAFLWGVGRLVERPGFWRWTWLVFALYALLLCGYPQHIVWCAWFAAGWVLVTLLRDARGGARLKLGLLVLGAAAVALLCAAPVYLDLLVDLQRSTRAGAGLDLALRSLPRLHSWHELRVFLVQLHDLLWLGDPLGPAYPRAVSVQIGSCLTPLLAALVAVALLRPRRRGVGWPLVFLGAVALLTASPPLFRLEAEHLGLSLSLLSPVTAALLPLAILAAFGADAVLVRDAIPRGAAALAAGVPLALALLAVAPGDIPLVAQRVLLGAAAAAGAVLFAWTGWRCLLVGLLVATVFVWGRPFVFLRPRADIRLDSPLVSRVRELTADGGRFAWIGPPPGGALAPNEEALLGLRSVHFHNCFPSAGLQGWSARLGSRAAADDPDATAGYDRRFTSIADDGRLTPEDLATSGVRLLLSARPLDGALTDPGERVGPAWLARVHDPGPLQAQLDHWESRADGASVTADELRRSTHLVVRRQTGHDDELVLQVEPLDHPSLLFVSQEHHPSWRAWADGAELSTLPVNGLFEGVVLPAGTRELRLAFRPWARWSLLPQLAFVALGSLWVLGAVRRWRSRRA